MVPIPLGDGTISSGVIGCPSVVACVTTLRGTTTEPEHIVNHVRPDIHQAVAAVVSLAATVDVSEFPDFSFFVRTAQSLALMRQPVLGGAQRFAHLSPAPAQ